LDSVPSSKDLEGGGTICRLEEAQIIFKLHKKYERHNKQLRQKQEQAISHQTTIKKARATRVKVSPQLDSNFNLVLKLF
jgi:hypothetical protein